MVWDPRLIDYLNSKAIEDQGVPPSWAAGVSAADAPQAAQHPVAPAPTPSFDIMSYFKAMKPEMFSQEAYDKASADDAETNRNRQMARSFAQAAGYFTGRPADYTGLEPSQDALKNLQGKQEQALKSAEVGSKVAQFATAMDAQSPTSAASLFAYRDAMQDPIIGPRVRAMGPPGRVSAADIARITTSVKTGADIGKDVATAAASNAQAGNSIADTKTKEAMRTGQVEGQRLGNQKTATEIPGIQATTAKTNAEADKIKAETAQIGKTQVNKAGDDLRSQWLNQPDYKNAQTVADAYAKIKSTPNSGAGDVALLYGYMKILDPNSAVREGEIALGKDTGSVPESIRIAYNKAVAGEQFTPEMRQRFREAARQSYNAQMARYETTAEEFRRLARERGVDPAQVVLNTGLAPDNAGGSSGAGLSTWKPE